MIDLPPCWLPATSPSVVPLSGGETPRSERPGSTPALPSLPVSRREGDAPAVSVAKEPALSPVLSVSRREGDARRNEKPRSTPAPRALLRLAGGRWRAAPPLVVDRVAAAQARGAALHGAYVPRRPQQPAPRSFFAFGDPQAPFSTLLRVLARSGLLGADGWIDPRARVLSIGDHFEYRGAPREVAEEGLQILAWLAAHPPEQVPLLAGNHDLARVLEFAEQSDESFAQARALSWLIYERDQAGQRAESLRLARTFFERFPGISTPAMAGRDYFAFTEAQRNLVRALLLAGRLRLAFVGPGPHQSRALYTHTGITTRELALLGLAGQGSPDIIAESLNAFLDRAVDRVRPAWEGGENVPLDLAPLYRRGVPGEVGGGFLYYRPVDPALSGLDRAWAFHPDKPRRFDPRSLPLGLVQVCGHTGHHRCRHDLASFATPAALAQDRGGLRTLSTDGERAFYELGLSLPDPRRATLYLIDAEMNSVSPDSYPLIEVFS